MAKMEAEARSTVRLRRTEAEAKRALGRGRRGSTLRSSGGWRRRHGASCLSYSKPWPASLDTCLHLDTHAHDREGIGYHFPGIVQYLNTSSGCNLVTHKIINYISWTFYGPSANWRRIEITVILPSNGWKFGLAMRGNLSADNELAVGFPRPLVVPYNVAWNPPPL